MKEMASSALLWGWTQGKDWERSGDIRTRKAQHRANWLFGKEPGGEDVAFSKLATLHPYLQPL